MIRYYSLLTASLLILQTATVTPADSRPLSITQRQQMLSRKIEKARRNNHLTFAEYNAMCDDLSDIRNRISRMKDENGGRLSYDNIETIEKKLNKLSVNLHKKQLAKRVFD